MADRPITVIYSGALKQYLSSLSGSFTVFGPYHVIQHRELQQHVEFICEGMIAPSAVQKICLKTGLPTKQRN